MLFPHISLALALLLATFGLVLRYVEAGSWSTAVGAAASATAVIILQPFMLLPITLVLAGYWLFTFLDGFFSPLIHGVIGREILGLGIIA